MFKSWLSVTVFVCRSWTYESSYIHLITQDKARADAWLEEAGADCTVDEFQTETEGDGG